jgi:hypothetical protein
MVPSPSTHRAIGGLLALGSFALFASTVGFDFVHVDDLRYVVKNPYLGHGLDLDTLRWAFTTHYFAWWHPLTWVSHLLDVRLFGLWAGGHHLTSALLHALNTWLAWRLLSRLGLPWPHALVATVLFAWHPMRVESVAWVSERKDVLSVAFALLTVHAWVGYRHAPSAGRYLLAALAFAAALASKVMVMTLPVTLLVLDLTVLREAARHATRARLVLEKLPLLVMAAAAALAVVARQRSGGAVSSLTEVSLVDRLGAVPWWVTRYLGKTLWPVDLCIMYPRVSPSGLQIAAGLVTVGLVTALGVWLARRGRPGPLLGWGLFVLTLTPVLGLVQTGAQAIADRYTHLGHLALFAGLVSALPLAAFQRRPVVVAAVGTALTLFALTLAQLQTWRDTDALFARALEVEPDNPFIERQLDGLPLEAMLAEGRLADAQAEAVKLLQKWPADARVMILAGTAAAQAGDYQTAIDRFTRALALEPGNDDAERFLAFAKEDARRR